MKRHLLLSLLLSLFIGTFLWLYSDAPPYGQPHNELSNNYWGFVIDVAHKWRSGEFSFWDMGVGGGTSLFSSGQYPLLNPTNMTAWFLNDNQFFLFKLIEPYVIGTFFTCLILLNIFQLRWPMAFFGALFYMGLILSRQTPMAQSSIFLWGCALFPAMVYVYLKLKDFSLLRAAAIGGVIALQFSGGGVIQVPQMIIWWMLFLTLESLTNKGSSLFTNIKIWFAAFLCLTFVAISLWGIQFIPSLLFSITESARLPGHHPINNFPLSGPPFSTKNLSAILTQALIRTDGAVSLRGIVAIILFAAGLIITQPKLLTQIKENRFVALLWVTTTTYILIPTICQFLTLLFPCLIKIITPLTMFTFRYALHTLDFCIALTLTLVLAQASLPQIMRIIPLRSLLAWFLWGTGILIGTLPALMFFLKPIHALLLNIHPYFCQLMPNHGSTAIAVAILTITVAITLISNHKQMLLIRGLALALLGSMTLITCYNWNNKGKQTHLELYQFDSPEHRYYRAAQNKYYLPFTEHPTMLHDYNLVFGVHGTPGFLPSPPYRFSKFMSLYHQKPLPINAEWTAYKYNMPNPSSGIVTYFPVEFTTINRDVPLPWPGFTRKVRGQFVDIWERTSPPIRVLSGHRIKIASLDDIILNFDNPFNGTILVEQRDTQTFKVHNYLSNNPQQDLTYSTFLQPRGDTISFKTKSSTDNVVVLPEIFQKGWEISIDGKKSPIFPAFYIFTGFMLEAGEHSIAMKFTPPGLWIGLVLNMLSILFLILLVYNYKRKS